MWRKVFNRLLTFSAIFVILVLGTGIGWADEIEGPMIYGRVIDVTPGESTEASFGEMKTEIVTIEIISSDAKGSIVTITNTFTGHPYYDIPVNTGDRVLLQSDEYSGETVYYLADYARDRSLIVITALFVISLVAIGGLKGLKALLSLVLMSLMVIYILLPLILQGYSPILVTVGICSILTMIFLFFIGGLNKKTVAAVVGTVGGLIVAGVLAFVVGRSTYLTGLSSSEAQMLQFLGNTIDFQGLLFSGMIIGALGAIIDVGMSVSSAIEQIRETDPAIALSALIGRGLNVGRDMLGTMANTLILAYLGTSLPLLLLFQASDTPWIKIINLDLIATEIVRAMAGSIGLALAIPLTTLVAGLLQIRTTTSEELSVD